MSAESTSRPKKKRIRPSASTIEEAVSEILLHKQSINKTAQDLNISRAYLAKIVKKVRASGEMIYKHCPNIGNKRIFSIEQEDLLADYLKTASKMCYGLTRHQAKKLAYDYAVANKICPETWVVSEIASDEWLRGFMGRHSDLSIRKPENTSLSRATSFNKTNVETFFDKLSSIYDKFKFPPYMIFNTDETGCSTVTNPPKVIAERGSKQVGQVTSAERGTLVTTLFFINAAGGFLPPVFVFPRVHFKDNMLSNGPSGALGLAHSSGWMTEECFLKALDHFVTIVRPSAENPALILMDNHSSHVNLSVVEYARHNHIVILTFPPHCSHKLQPLDVSVYGPFKTRYRVAMNDWMLSNPGKTVTIYQVGQFVKEAYLGALSPNNISQGFLKTGIYPLNRNIFSENDYLPSFVTDRPDPSINLQQNEDTTLLENHEQATIQAIDNNSRTPSPSVIMNMDAVFSSTYHFQGSILPVSEQIEPLPSSSEGKHKTPEQIRPFLVAPPRKNNRVKSRKLTSAIITDTPEKDKIKAKVNDTKKNKKNVKKMTTKNAIKVLHCKSKLKKKMSSSESSLDVSIHGDSADSDDEPLLQMTKKILSSISGGKLNMDKCVVCKKLYSTSKEEWYQCKICCAWAHESCGIKGSLNYFCQNCF